MKKKPQISVIIPTYHTGEYFFECLNSIYHQSISKEQYEIIIVLNGEKEPYFSKINEYIKTFMLNVAVNVIYTNKKGVSNARNIGIDIANGDYIAFIDDDDLITPNYLSELISRANPNSIVVSNVVLLNDEDGSYSVEYSATKAFAALSKNGYKDMFNSRRVLNGPWMKLFPKNVIGDTRFNTHIKLGEDALFSFMISKNVNTLVFTSPAAKYIYRQRKGASWSNKQLKELLRNMIYLHYLYIKTYIMSPFKYDFLYMISRLVAVNIRFMSYIFKKHQ